MSQVGKRSFFYPFIILAFSGSLITLTYQGCGPSFQTAKKQELLNSNNSNQEEEQDSSSDQSLTPEYKLYMKPNLVTDCMNDPNYNACIFWKNPVAQRQAPYKVAITLNSNLTADQIHAVKILGTDNSGLLRNSTINVTTSSGTRINSPDMDFKIAYNGNTDKARQANQVMVYHWLQTFISFMKEETGKFHGENQSIQVDANLNTLDNAFYRYNSNQIEIGITETGTPFALSGEIAVHELGHANHRWAGGYNFTNKDTTSCPSNIGGTCCTDRITGCGKALAEGAADYMYAQVFSTNTTGGESITNNILGPSRCGLNRDINDNINLTIDNIGCSNIHALGMVYAGIWNEVRKKAEANKPKIGAKEINILFSEHLMILLNDNWISIYNKIISLDHELYKGKYKPLFQQEFARRGIDI